MPSTQIEFDHGNKAFDGIVNRRHREEGFRMSHEAILCPLVDRRTAPEWQVCTHLVIRSSIDRGSRMNVGRTTRLKSAPGRSWEMICERTVNAS